jgi:phosphoadenosine phosphosulfate reductase
MRVTPKHLDALNDRFEGKHPLEVMRFVHEAFGSRAAILSSMQRAGTTMCQMADTAGLAFDVVFVDTGVLHPETLWTRDQVVRLHKRLSVITIQPDRTLLEQCADEGVLYVTREGQERCCRLRKKEPLLKLRGKYDALLASLRRDEGGSRSRTRTFALDSGMNALRVHPFAYFKRDDIQDYATRHPELPLNPLHSLGFASIGCYTCTTPVMPGEGDRAGRWRHLAGVEYCGINPMDVGLAETSIELDDRYAGLFGSASE